MKKKLLISALLILVLPIGLFAIQETGVNNNLLAEVSPTSPGPGEQVTINLSSYGFDIDSSFMSWSVNGETVVVGTGKKSFVFSLGPVGVQTNVTVYVEARGGQKASKTFIFDPTEIDLFWETQTSKPAFYQGKALPSAGSIIKIVALPYIVNHDGQKITSDNLIYNWKRNGVSMGEFSGLGKNSAIVNANQENSQVKISVEALSQADNIRATKDLIINLVKPEVVFYEKKPLEGINYGQVLSTEYPLFDEEVTVRAEPYFLPINSNLFFKYLWTLDQSPAESRPDDPLAITLRRGQDVSGSNRVNFSVQGQNSTFSNYFIVKYGNGLLKPQI
ncbi:MAG: hypothetical protein WC640_00675 [Candidatus Paceibacterota bacterium]|jgi:hypothetical protein